MENLKEIEKYIDSSRVKYNEPMKKHTTMKVGGNAKILVEPINISEIIGAIAFAKKNNLEYYIIGNGSNLVVADEGVDGLIIKLANKFSSIELRSDGIMAYAGASMPYLASEAKRNYLTGLEFACGIPGTIGGGVKMNAGAYGSEMSNIVSEVTYLDEDSNIKKMKAEDMKFAYRDSIFKQNDKYVILEVILKLNTSTKEEIGKKMEENTKKRLEKQPLDKPNSGSVFKRPEGHFVGPMIIECGLQGFCVGDAQVSTKHAGFIVNKGNATCKDIKELIKIIQQKVYEKFNVKLETEIQFIGGKK